MTGRTAAGTVLLAFAVLLGAVAAAAAERYRLRVDGLTCPFCAYGIEKRLLKLDGVASVETHVADGVVVVSMDEGARLTEAAARRAVQDAGFTLEGFRAAAEDE